METLYRKVAVSERLPEFGQRVIALVLEQNYLGLSKFLWNVSYSDITKSFKMDGNTVQIEYWLEEIPDNSRQIEKLEAHLQDEINEFSVLGYEPSQYQLGYNSAINDIMEILRPTPKI